jgi:hypothetical protein
LEFELNPEVVCGFWWKTRTFISNPGIRLPEIFVVSVEGWLVASSGLIRFTGIPLALLLPQSKISILALAYFR